MPSQDTLSALNPAQSKKIFYIDHLKVALTILVVMHHAFVTYGAPGGWYYSEKTAKIGALIPMTLFVSVNQAFFMGFFFFLSSYFIRPSYHRKGAWRFLTDRLLRLGIPLLFYSFILSPLLNYLVYYFGKGSHISYLQYLSGFDGWIDFGVLWFVAALLLFTLIYVLCRSVFKITFSKSWPAPTAGSILLFAVGVGVISFFVRTIFPVGWSLKPLGFQFAHFSQYIALFILGLVASKNDWLNNTSFSTGKKLALLVSLLLLFFPIFYLIIKTQHMPQEWFSGGFHWQQLLYAVWEQLIGFSMITALICFGKKLWNKQSGFTLRLSRYSFAVYIFHPLVLISLSLSIRNWAVDPSLKLLLVAPLAVVFSFLLASIVVMIRGVKKII